MNIHCPSGILERLFLDVEYPLQVKSCMKFIEANACKPLHRCVWYVHTSFTQSSQSLQELGTGTVLRWGNKAQSPKASQLPRVSWPTLFKKTLVNGPLVPHIDLSCLISFTQHVFEVHLICSMYVLAFLFITEYSIRMGTSHFVLSSHWLMGFSFGLSWKMLLWKSA